MIAFCVTGGIGDTLLAVPVIQKIKEMFNERILVINFDKPSEIILKNIYDVDTLCFGGMVSHEQFYKNVKDCGLIIWNLFRKDHEGHCNLFTANNNSYKSIVSDMRKKYFINLSSDWKIEIKDLYNNAEMNMIRLSNEEDYYIDYRRYGIDVNFSDLNIDIPEKYIIKNKNKVDSLGDYFIFHDSRLYGNQATLKGWDIKKWNSLSEKILNSYNIKIVDFFNQKEKIFKNSIPSEEIIGSEGDFFDYLYLLSRCKNYVGTCSWPSVASIFLDDVNFIIMKGPSVRRWDFESKFANIIRKGECQGCFCIDIDDGSPSYQNKCRIGGKPCMNNINVEDIISLLK